MHLKGIDPKLIKSRPKDNFTPALRTIVDAWQRPIRYVHPKFDGLFHPTGDPAGFMTLSDAAVLGPPPQGRIYATDGVRRNNAAAGGEPADSDGGLCVGNHPYFYSAGPDGDPSTIEDNVYSVKPQFAEQ